MDDELLRVAESEDWGVIVPREAVENSKLGFAALGLLVYLLGGGPGYKIRMSKISERCEREGTCARDLVSELKKLGYAAADTDFFGRDLPKRDENHPPHVVISGRQLNLKKRRGKSSIYTSYIYGECLAGNSPKNEGFQLQGWERKPKTEAERACFLFFHWLKEKHLDQIALTGGRSKRISPNPSSWIKACKETMAVVGQEEFYQVLNWYMEHHREAWVGSYYSMPKFCLNFDKVRKARERAFDRLSSQPFPGESQERVQVVARRVD